jgi:pimeloyl-ACP methyl ester carboxylesterase
MATTVQVTTNIRPFHVDIPDEKLADLRRLIGATRWPSAELVTDSSQGVQSKMLQKLARYWEKEHDWRKVEKKLNALPQFLITIDGLDIHFIHVKSRHKDAMPLIITHGWPGSVIEMLDVIGPLTDPTAYGGGADEGFDLVVPSLPGFGFSGQPTELGWNPGRVARAWAELMQRLGYTRYVAQGGDIGANVTDELARLAPAGLAGIHLNFLWRTSAGRSFQEVGDCRARGTRREEGTRGTRCAGRPLQAGLLRRDARASADDRLRVDRYARRVGGVDARPR